MQQIQRLNVAEFISVSVQLAHRAAFIIRDVSLSQELGKQMKGEDDPYTIADVKAQTLIINGLKKFWPSLKIIGEESQNFDGDIDIDFLNPNLFHQSIFETSYNNEKIETHLDITDDLVVWVDPLDGTLSYVKNELDAVTTLIGLSNKNLPIAGIIGHPYPDQTTDNNYIFNPKVYFGYTHQQKVYYAYDKQIHQNNTFIPFELSRLQQQIKEKYIISTSKNRLTQEVSNKIYSLNPQTVINVGGSGKKCIQILNGESDFYIYVGNMVKRWDICPGDALLRCLGNRITSLNGQSYSYDVNEMPMTGEPYGIDNGLIASLLPEKVLKKIYQVTKDFL